MNTQTEEPSFAAALSAFDQGKLETYTAPSARQECELITPHARDALCGLRRARTQPTIGTSEFQRMDEQYNTKAYLKSFPSGPQIASVLFITTIEMKKESPLETL